MCPSRSAEKCSRASWQFMATGVNVAYGPVSVKLTDRATRASRKVPRDSPAAMDRGRRDDPARDRPYDASLGPAARPRSGAGSLVQFELLVVPLTFFLPLPLALLRLLLSLLPTLL
jgi:hypothetical protein